MDKAGTSRTTRWYHTDHLGSSNVLTSQTGAVVERAEYTPYGTVIHRTGTANVPQKFTGQRLDATGLYFYNARYYDAATGRFLTPDIIVQGQDDPQTLNRYSYCRNNPVRLVDPSGHGFFKRLFQKWFQSVVVATIAVAVLAIAVALPGGQPVAALATSAFAKTAVITAGAAAATNVTLDTGTGRQIQRNLANEVFDDALGFSPRAAAIASSVATHAVLSWGLEQAGARLVLRPGQSIGQPTRVSDGLNAGRSLSAIAKDGSANVIQAIGTPGGGEFQYALVAKRGLFGAIPTDIFGPLKPLVDKYQSTNLIGWQHVASSGQEGLWSGGAKALHGTLKGLCVNEANLAAATQGLSWTASQAANATYTTYLAEIAYGVYGNQLPNAAVNWIVSNRNYHAE